MSRLFATHPPDAERIRRTQEEIQRILPAKPEYVVTTSGYSAMRQRLIDLGSDRDISVTGAGTPNGAGRDERPTLQRRD